VRRTRMGQECWDCRHQSNHGLGPCSARKTGGLVCGRRTWRIVAGVPFCAYHYERVYDSIYLDCRDDLHRIDSSIWRYFGRAFQRGAHAALLTTQDVSEWLMMEPEQIRELAAAGRLPYRKRKNRFLFEPAELLLWANGSDLTAVSRDRVKPAAPSVTFSNWSRRLDQLRIERMSA
jgi:hypothetical protein